MSIGIHLARQEASAARFARARQGTPVGIAGVADDLNRQASRARVPGRAPVWGFTWNHQDNNSTHWWPQGISTSADADRSGTIDGRRMLVVSWYSHGTAPRREGSRLTFVDLETLRYRHVLVVLPGRNGPEPLHIHAGGVVWAGDRLHLAGTGRGLFTAHVEDLARVAPSEATFGYHYVLPVRAHYHGGADDGITAMRYSFLSLDRGGTRPGLVTGEYGRAGQTTRLVRYSLDDDFELARDAEGRAVPLVLDQGVGHMQGAAVVDGTYYVTVSRGSTRLGRLYVGRPGRLRPHRWALPPGVEDISYWPQTDQLWSLSEYPGRRFVFALRRGRLRLFPTRR